VTKCLSDPDADVRRLACVVLRAVGEAGQPALPKLTPLLGDGDFSVRIAAAFAMQKLAPERREFVPVFAEAIRKGVGGVIVDIGSMGPDAVWAVPLLTEALAGPEDTLQWLAAEALGKIGPRARDAIPALEKATRSKDERVSAAAKTALQSVRATSAP
jgi:HEAT repeat protein